MVEACERHGDHRVTAMEVIYKRRQGLGIAAGSKLHEVDQGCIRERRTACGAAGLFLDQHDLAQAPFSGRGCNLGQALSGQLLPELWGHLEGLVRQVFKESPDGFLQDLPILVRWQLSQHSGGHFPAIWSYHSTFVRSLGQRQRAMARIVSFAYMSLQLRTIRVDMSASQLPAKSKAEDAPIAQFQRIRSSRAFDEIAAQIRMELSSGRLAVGNRLPSERALSEQFGVSRNTLREALRSLEHAGLIRLQKGARGGAFISQHSDEAIATGLMDMYHVGTIQPAQLTEARIWLESVVVREACRRATAADIDTLNRNIDEAQEARRRGDFAGRAERHIEFHRMLARLTDNPIMVIVMNGVLDVLAHFVQRIGEYDNSFVLPSRRRFMEHFAAGDAEAAVAEMEACLKRLQRSYMSRIQAAEGVSATKAPPRGRRSPPAAQR